LFGSAQTECLPNAEFIHRAESEGWLTLVDGSHSRMHVTSPRSPTVCCCYSPNRRIKFQGSFSNICRLGDRFWRSFNRILQPNGCLCEAACLISAFIRVQVPRRWTTKLLHISVAPSAWFEANFNAERQTHVLDSIIRSVHSQPTRRVPDRRIPENLTLSG
jgi:hypothetical protein